MRLFTGQGLRKSASYSLYNPSTIGFCTYIYTYIYVYATLHEKIFHFTLFDFKELRFSEVYLRMENMKPKE